MQFLKLKMKPEERECCLTFDEMVIQAGMQYDRELSCMCGNITLPEHEGETTHALVLMLGGITTRWKQTVAYRFTGNSVHGATLKPIVLEILQRTKDIVLHVNSVTSDMGSANRALWQRFGKVCSRYAKIVNMIDHPVAAGRHLHFICRCTTRN